MAAFSEVWEWPWLLGYLLEEHATSSGWSAELWPILGGIFLSFPSKLIQSTFWTNSSRETYGHNCPFPLVWGNSNLLNCFWLKKQRIGMIRLEELLQISLLVFPSSYCFLYWLTSVFVVSIKFRRLNQSDSCHRRWWSKEHFLCLTPIIRSELSTLAHIGEYWFYRQTQHSPAPISSKYLTAISTLALSSLNSGVDLSCNSSFQTVTSFNWTVISVDKIEIG